MQRTFAKVLCYHCERVYAVDSVAQKLQKELSQSASLISGFVVVILKLFHVTLIFKSSRCRFGGLAFRGIGPQHLECCD
jgi:hypothetical protein